MMLMRSSRETRMMAAPANVVHQVRTDPVESPLEAGIEMATAAL